MKTVCLLGQIRYVETFLITLSICIDLFQVIVIVTNTWWVYCYSSDLELLWQRQLLDFGSQFEDYYVKAMGALVTSHSVKKTDDGLIIVGGSYAHKAHKIEETNKNEYVKSTVYFSTIFSLIRMLFVYFFKILSMSRDMGFPTMWYVRPAIPQISLRTRSLIRAFACRLNIL